MQISWINNKDIIEYELRQLELDGFDIELIKIKWNELKLISPSPNQITDFMLNIYNEIEDYQKNFFSIKVSNDKEFIKKVNNEKNLEFYKSVIDETLYDKILGGWLGRSAGCLLGKPVEKYSREIIKEILEKSDQYPLKYYISGVNLPEKLKLKYPWNKHSGKESLLENLKCMTEDDDLNYPMLNLKIAEQSPKLASTELIAKYWLENIPVMSTFTAERVVYKNLLNGNFTESSYYQNPYREWIGALIRADLWGWISAGNPQQAAIRAYNDASLTHISNGVWGEVFISVMISLSFVLNDEIDLVNHSLKYIPADSEVSKVIVFVINLVATEDSWEIIVNELHKKFNNLHWVHVLNNIALIVAVILYWKKDFDNAICSTVMAGWDTDSNGATVGSIIGTKLGALKLPDRWTLPLNNTIRSSMKGFDKTQIDELAKRTLNITKINLEK